MIEGKKCSSSEFTNYEDEEEIMLSDEDPDSLPADSPDEGLGETEADPEKDPGTEVPPIEKELDLDNPEPEDLILD